jgi:hypothetical protein
MILRSRAVGFPPMGSRASRFHLRTSLPSRYTCTCRGLWSPFQLTKTKLPRRTLPTGDVTTEGNTCKRASSAACRHNGPRVQLRRPPLRPPYSRAAGPRVAPLPRTTSGGLRQVQLEVRRGPFQSAGEPSGLLMVPHPSASPSKRLATAPSLSSVSVIAACDGTIR